MQFADALAGEGEQGVQFIAAEGVAFGGSRSSMKPRASFMTTFMSVSQFESSG